MNVYIRAQNRTMIVWEGFDPAPTDGAEVISKDVVVSPFDSVRLKPWLYVKISVVWVVRVVRAQTFIIDTAHVL